MLSVRNDNFDFLKTKTHAHTQKQQQKLTILSLKQSRDLVGYQDASEPCPPYTEMITLTRALKLRPNTRLFAFLRLESMATGGSVHTYRLHFR